MLIIPIVLQWLWPDQTVIDQTVIVVRSRDLETNLPNRPHWLTWAVLLTPVLGAFHSKTGLEQRERCVQVFIQVQETCQHGLLSSRREFSGAASSYCKHNHRSVVSLHTL